MDAAAAATPAPPAPPAPTPAPSGRALRDFQDWLSPMLVKELRQGTRAALFVWPLIVMNLALAVIVWLMALSPGEGGLTDLFWWIIVIAICGLLPLRASTALHDELRGGTIDTLVLTRLTGWRIALGKWVAVAAQQVLLAVTVMPYLLVRYFTGGVDVGPELLWLLAFLTGGVVAAGVLAGFSWLPHFLLRAGLMIGVLLFGGSMAGEFIHRRVGDPEFWSVLWGFWGWTGFAAAATALGHAVFFALDTAAGRAGSRLENRSAMRRLTATGALSVYGLVILLESGASYSQAAVFSSLCAAGAAILVMIQAMAETPVPLAPVARPFVRRGRIGRFAGRFLYPGWPSGIRFSAVICAVFCAVLLLSLLDYLDSSALRGGGYSYSYSYSHGYGYGYPGSWGSLDLPDVVMFLGVIGTLTVPPVLYHLIFRRWLPWHAGIYTLLLAMAMAAHLIISATADGLDTPSILFPGLILPSMGATALDDPPGNLSELAVLGISFAVTAAWWVAALILAGKGMREMLEVEKGAAREPGPA